jgi:hypothetical protein
MKDFKEIDWKIYNRPPFYQQWLCRGDTLKLTTFGDRRLAGVDDQIIALKDQWDLESVRGRFLDRIGKLLNENRNGNIDEYYRILLKLRRLLNTNNGSIPSIIKAIKFIYSSEVVHVVPDYPAGIIIEHDGEGTPGLNFNRLLTEIVPAGVSFSTKELFYFTDNVDITDLVRIIVKRKDAEYFGHPIKFNGMIKFDGHTVNDRVSARGKFNGIFKFNGDLKFNGFGKLLIPYRPAPPFKFSSGIVDKLVMEATKNNLSDQIETAEAVSAGFRKHHHFDGTYKFDGSIRFDSMVLIPWK